MLKLWRALPALLLLLAPAAARADERINHFWSDVQIQKDSSLEVTETIDVQAERSEINHGIYRDFPTRYRSRHGGYMRVGFTFEGATLDGADVPAKTESISNGIRIKLGDPDKYIDIGEHRFVIRYRTTRQIGRFKDYDELYWNATGNGWMFPIDVAEARIRLPGPVKFGQRAAYTGPQGATASNAEVVDEKPGDITFRTTQPLGPYQGLTVAVAFPKGVVADLSQDERAASWLADNGPPIVGFLGLVGLCVFYYIAWQRAGRDPRAGTVVPIFAPPDDLSPAGMRYIREMGADNRAFAAALVDMGVRGHIKMVEEEGGWFSRNKTRIERLSASSALPPEEDAALRALVQPGESIMMVQSEHTKFSAAKSGLDATLKNAYEGKMFKRNWGWAAAGLILFVAAVWLAALSVDASTGAADWSSIILGFAAMAGLAVLALFFRLASTVANCVVSIVVVVLATFALPFVFPVITGAMASGWYLPLILPAIALPLVISAFWWISAPTVEGRKILDHIAGFKQYLSITERERLDRMTPPADTPELFEKYLPFAIALGVENRWAERFAGVLAAAAVQGQQGFAWYAGSGSPWNNPTGFVSSVGSGLASTISSASTAPGSSSGSGGGGSSGGGGGGGGGGGW